MGKSDIGGGEAPKTSPRPSLVNTTALAQSPNILDAMGGASARKPVVPPAKFKAAWLLLPLVGLAVWGLLRSPLSSPPDAAPAQTLAVQTPAVAPPVVVAAAEPVVVATPAQPPAEPASPFTELKAEVPSTEAPAAAAAAAVSEPAPETQAAPKPVPKPPVVAAAPKLPKVAVAAPAQPKPVIKAAAPKPAEKEPPRITRTAKASTGVDSDAALIDAILKNLGTARTPQTIADLVKTCQGKDSIDGLICRRRICAGFWGKADVCPMNLAPQSVQNPQAASDTQALR